MSMQGFTADGVATEVGMLPGMYCHTGAAGATAVFFQTPRLASWVEKSERLGGSCQMIPPRSTPNDAMLSVIGVAVDPMPGMSYSGVLGAHQPAAVIDSMVLCAFTNLRIFVLFPSASP